MIVRSSSFASYKTCPRKAYYKYTLGLVRKGRNTADVDFGKSVHEAIETFHMTGSLDRAISKLNDLPIPNTPKKNYRSAQALVTIYANAANVEVIEPERNFEFAIGHHIWKGKLDATGKYSVDQRKYVIEHKTTNPRFLLTKPNDQFISYYIGAKLIDDEIAGVILNNLDPEKIAINRHIVTFSKPEVDFWLRETKLVLDMYEMSTDTGIFYRNPSACFMYNRICNYHELCMNPVDDQTVMEALYEKNQEAIDLSW